MRGIRGARDHLSQLFKFIICFVNFGQGDFYEKEGQRLAKQCLIFEAWEGARPASYRCALGSPGQGREGGRSPFVIYLFGRCW